MLGLLALAGALALKAFRQNLVFFITPSEIVQGRAPAGERFRLGGLFAALAQALLPLAGAQRGDARWMALVRPLAGVSFGLVSVALAALITGFMQADTSIAYVAANASHELPLGYRITAKFFRWRAR